MTKRKLIFIFYLIWIILVLSSCNDKLEVQQKYLFTVTTMPAQSEIAEGETVEIRFQIHSEGHFEETEYFIRFFQTDGKGVLMLEDGTVLLPNDLYLLPSDKFRLNYTSSCTEQQKIDVYIEDNFGQMEMLGFGWRNEK
ncbi:DUF3872 domain-containing protein [Bacteroidales bacterium OttesenSCG-928-K03]|nr:DUF3872 domain-containing protein [Odoribacter sp. OttesenSCG-928-L07]MDL2239170.1 DUF3872 domain-containing protein [Bacteroidales bacterium OttesenSCG-928-L14]MDL2240169.1 DUF3872 domain-containing protein [Bacteroidales bacterium OttesenSCG-928-K22]MDL2242476.1 DUF3872 domain-containing protein [Bacteroidales bacterium OttesenSCG-928-K03]